jgi:hypothetical protein
MLYRTRRIQSQAENPRIKTPTPSGIRKYLQDIVRKECDKQEYEIPAVFENCRICNITYITLLFLVFRAAFYRRFG